MEYNLIKALQTKCAFCWFLLRAVYHNARFKNRKVC